MPLCQYCLCDFRSIDSVGGYKGNAHLPFELLSDPCVSSTGHTGGDGGDAGFVPTCVSGWSKLHDRQIEKEIHEDVVMMEGGRILTI